MEKRKDGQIWGAEPFLAPSITDLDPVLNLSCAVLKRAAIEGRRGDLGAAAWLASNLAGVFCDVLGLDHLKVQSIAIRWMEYPAGKIVIKVFVGG